VAWWSSNWSPCGFCRAGYFAKKPLVKNHASRFTLLPLGWLVGKRQAFFTKISGAVILFFLMRCSLSLSREMNSSEIRERLWKDDLHA
jgi:hypothetical protein